MTTELLSKDRQGCYRLASLASFPVIAAFSDRTFNMRFQEDLLPGQKDREVFCARLNFSAGDLVCPEQIHSANIMMVHASMKGCGAFSRQNAAAQVDGMITRERGVPLGVQTADCAPVFFYDPKRGAIGMAHVGWKGLASGLPEKMVAAMAGHFLSRPEDIWVGFGPMIRSCCFEIGEDVAAFFSPFAASRKGKLYLDLAAAISERLRQNGISKTRIEDSGYCTSCRTDLFYSYRREGKSTGRMLSVMMLE